jgi:hypothetical protein
MRIFAIIFRMQREFYISMIMFFLFIFSFPFCKSSRPKSNVVFLYEISEISKMQDSSIENGEDSFELTEDEGTDLSFSDEISAEIQPEETVGDFQDIFIDLIDAVEDSADILTEIEDVVPYDLPVTDDLAAAEDIIPVICFPFSILCQGIDLYICDESGTGMKFLSSCNDNIPCTEDTCTDGVCANNQIAPDCCVPPCQTGFECIDHACKCKPDCQGKQCGSDGCGGSCGTCPANYACQEPVCVFQCPSCQKVGNCVMDDFSGHAYYLCPQTINWDDAYKFCKNKGTHLVTISSGGENDFIKNFIAGTDAWIGMYHSWGKWYWVNEEPMSFTNWAQGEPSFSLFNPEDCVEMWSWGQWNNESCWTKLKFVCEFEP